MARQIFLSGGFVGKLGNVIGERWHGQFYVKTYAKPANPKTPAQIANRDKFSLAVSRAKFCFNYTRQYGIFKNDSNGEFPYMIGQAKRAINADAPERDLWPFIPDWTPTISVSVAPVLVIDAPNDAQLIFSSTTDLEGRKMAAFLYGVDPAGNMQICGFQSQTLTDNPIECDLVFGTMDILPEFPAFFAIAYHPDSSRVDSLFTPLYDIDTEAPVDSAITLVQNVQYTTSGNQIGVNNLFIVEGVAIGPVASAQSSGLGMQWFLSKTGAIFAEDQIPDTWIKGGDDNRVLFQRLAGTFTTGTYKIYCKGYTKKPYDGTVGYVEGPEVILT
jgi:hypothetical protein